MMLRWIACLLAISTVTVQADEIARPAPRPVRVQTVSFVPAQDAVTYPGTVQARVQASLGVPRRRQGDRAAGGYRRPCRSRAGAGPARSGRRPDRAGSGCAGGPRRGGHGGERPGRISALPAPWPRFAGLAAVRVRQAPGRLDGAEARLAQAQRQLAMARDQLDYTTLVADAGGVITDLKLEVGQVVAAGQTVLTLAHAAETEIVVDVPENRLPDIRAARGSDDQALVAAGSGADRAGCGKSARWRIRPAGPSR